MIIEHNITTGEIIEREMTSDELAQLAIDQAKTEERVTAEAAAQATKAAAEAKLAALGLTIDDLKALGLN